MSTELEPAPRDSADRLLEAKQRKRPRSGWQLYLIEVEQGIRQCFRGDSTFFVHFFLVSITLAAGVVLSLNVTQWCLILLASSWVISAEMFQQVLKAIWEQVGDKLDQGSGRILSIGTAAVFVAFTAAIVVVLAVLATRFWELFLR